MPTAFCPECDAELHIDEDTDKGEVIVCADCDTRLEVVGLDPVEVDLAPDDEEDDGYGTDDDD